MIWLVFFILIFSFMIFCVLCAIDGKLKRLIEQYDEIRASKFVADINKSAQGEVILSDAAITNSLIGKADSK